MSSDNILKISELSDNIKSLLPNKKFRVIGEVSQPKQSGGHLYFSLKDESNNLKAIIWKSKNINLNEIKDGSKITVDCKLDFYGGTSNINLIIEKLITVSGEGDLFIKYDKIKKDFMKRGYFDNNRKKKLGYCIKNILILTRESGAAAAIHDFVYALQNNKSKINYDIIDVPVQGVDCPKVICDKLEELKDNNVDYDLVVITRGGGSFEDLFGFSQPELIESVYNFHLPVLSAIGHQIDNPLLDLVADYSAPTPSLAAQFIVDYNKNYINSLEMMREQMKNKLINVLNMENNKLNKHNDKLNRMYNELNSLKNECQNKLLNTIRMKLNDLSMFDNRLDSLKIRDDKIVLMNRNNEVIDDIDEYIGKKIIMVIGNKEYKIKIYS